ncbi:MAG: hypothetical protein ABJN69_17380 [Hellea sp.]
MGRFILALCGRSRFYLRQVACLAWLICFGCLSGVSFAQVPPQDPSDANTQATEQQEELDSRQQLIRSLLSLNETLEGRKTRLNELITQLDSAEETTDRPALETEVGVLAKEIIQAGDEIEIVVLGLQAREYIDIGKEQSEGEIFDLGTEIGQIFQPLIVSLERATEPSRRMEELRQLSSRTKRKQEVAQTTLDSIAQFQQDGTEYPEALQDRLNNYNTLWSTRLQEAVDLGNALDEQLEAASRAKGSTFAEFAEDFGSFVLNRGASLLLALGLGIGFLIMCQLLRVALANFYRTKHTGVLSAPIRIIGMIISMIGVIGALIIAITVFNIRHDWLMLAMSLLLALAISWSFVRALPTLIEETRVLLNLGSVREGERTIVNGIPYRIDRLSMYSKLVNPALNGGSLIFPVREMINMHSRPVVEGEAWFPTDIGDWIVRGGKHYEVINQTPEHVIIRRPGGSEDFIPVQDFVSTLFESLSEGYRKTHIIGLSYKHLALAESEIPVAISEAVHKRVAERIGDENILGIETRLTELSSSSLDFKVLIDIAPGQGPHWDRIQSDISNGTIDVCLEQGWEIPFPQLVVHKD